MKAIDMVLSDLKNYPEDFEKGEFELFFRPTWCAFGLARGYQYSVWVASGLFFYELYKPNREFSFLDKIRFHFEYKKWLRSAPFKRKKEIEGLNALIGIEK